MVAENKAYDNGTPYWKDYGSSKNTFTLRITIISTKEEIYQSDCKICTPAVSWMNFTYFAHGIQQPILKLLILFFVFIWWKFRKWLSDTIFFIFHLFLTLRHWDLNMSSFVLYWVFSVFFILKVPKLKITTYLVRST